MAELKLTKNELRSQQEQWAQLNRYLPTLKLKKALLQSEVSSAKQSLETIALREKAMQEDMAQLMFFKSLFDWEPFVGEKRCKIGRENVAGIEVPVLESLEFITEPYDLFSTPAWLDKALVEKRFFLELQEELNVARERVSLLEKELREVMIRVNLFEKILIPRALANIKKIKIFLSDQQLTAVAQAKVAKQKHKAIPCA
jgi:V/A-type H+-transporting ATPase subunit D